MSTAITPALARRIELWPTDRLVPYTKNARTHSPEQVAQIAASIAEFGFNSPILVDSNAGIIAGHGRLLAARKLGLKECPVVVLDHLSESQRRAYIIADNKLALNAGWDDAVLAAELRDLEHEGLDLALVGFSEEELESLLAGVDEPEQAPDVAEDVPEAPANPGKSARIRRRGPATCLTVRTSRGWRHAQAGRTVDSPGECAAPHSKVPSKVAAGLWLRICTISSGAVNLMGKDRWTPCSSDADCISARTSL